MSLRIPVSDRFREAAEEWAEVRLMESEEALETKAEQALLEIEHLVSGATAVEFEVEDETIVYTPSDELAEFLAARADSVGIDEAEIVSLYVDLFARVFLEDDSERPSNAPPR